LNQSSFGGADDALASPRLRRTNSNTSEFRPFHPNENQPDSFELWVELAITSGASAAPVLTTSISLQLAIARN
jgi:hypothetical protein